MARWSGGCRSHGNVEVGPFVDLHGRGQRRVDRSGRRFRAALVRNSESWADRRQWRSRWMTITWIGEHRARGARDRTMPSGQKPATTGGGGGAGILGAAGVGEPTRRGRGRRLTCGHCASERKGTPDGEAREKQAARQARKAEERRLTFTVIPPVPGRDMGLLADWRLATLAVAPNIRGRVRFRYSTLHEWAPTCYEL